MPLIGGKNAKKKSSSDSKRHFTVVMGNKENGLYVSSSPSSAARKAVSKLCATDKKRKVQFSIREITRGSKKKTYGPYLGEIEKLGKPIELKGRVIKYKPVAKLNRTSSIKDGKKMRGGTTRHEYKLFGMNGKNNYKPADYIMKIFKKELKPKFKGKYKFQDKKDESFTFVTFDNNTSNKFQKTLLKLMDETHDHRKGNYIYKTEYLNAGYYLSGKTMNIENEKGNGNENGNENEKGNGNENGNENGNGNGNGKK